MIHRLEIPTPFGVGAVNCYLVEDDPLTLVDTGPNYGRALDALERAVARHGRRLDDVERIVLTHHHPDHEGLLDIIKHRSGAEVVALDVLAPWLTEWRAQQRADDSHGAAVMRRNGVSEDLASVLEALSSQFRQWGSQLEPDTVIADGGSLAFAGRTWVAHHRPGHSSTDTIFHDVERRELIGGDHLISHISSNPLLSKDQPRALVTYMESMQATAAMDGVDTVLAGHGDPVTDVGGLVESRLKMHERRARKIAGMIDEGPMTAHEIARSMWGDVAIKQAFLTLSEVLGHLDLLVAEGAVVSGERDGAGTVHFERA